MSYDPIFEISKTLNLNPFIMINLHSMVEYSALPDRSPFSFFFSEEVQTFAGHC